LKIAIDNQTITVININLVPNYVVGAKVSEDKSLPNNTPKFKFTIAKNLRWDLTSGSGAVDRWWLGTL